MSFKKRVLALALSLVLAFCLAVPAFAAPATAVNPENYDTRSGFNGFAEVLEDYWARRGIPYAVVYNAGSRIQKQLNKQKKKPADPESSVTFYTHDVSADPLPERVDIRLASMTYLPNGTMDAKFVVRNGTSQWVSLSKITKVTIVSLTGKVIAEGDPEDLNTPLVMTAPDSLLTRATKRRGQDLTQDVFILRFSSGTFLPGQKNVQNVMTAVEFQYDTLGSKATLQENINDTATYLRLLNNRILAQ